jgi:nucleotide-binding universal stress UspA family protein
MIYSRILVPIDGSDTSELGRQEALRLAKDQGAEVRFLYVLDAHVVAMDPYGTINTGELIDALREYGTELLAKAQADAQAQGLRASTAIVDTIAVRVGSEIVREAADWQASLVVMGTHGRRGVSHMLMGSDAELVVRTSPVPVLLVRKPETARA